jgi:hypothetical protein
MEATTMDAENTELITQEQEPGAVETPETEAPEAETPEAEEAEEETEDLFSLDDEEAESEEEESDAVQEGDEETETTEEVAAVPPVVAEVPPTKAEQPYSVKEITAEAQRLVEEKAGKAFDEFDPEHIVGLTIEAQKLVRKVDNHRAAIAEAEQIKAAHGGEAFAKQWLGYMDNMRHADAKAMLDAEASGDYSLTLKHLKACAAKQKAATLGAPTTSATQRNKPPMTMPAGNGSAPARRKDKSVFGLDDF